MQDMQRKREESGRTFLKDGCSHPTEKLNTHERTEADGSKRTIVSCVCGMEWGK